MSHIPIINGVLANYHDELMKLTVEIAEGRHEYFGNSMARHDPIDKRMAVIKAKIEACEEILRRVS